MAYKCNCNPCYIQWCRNIVETNWFQITIIIVIIINAITMGLQTSQTIVNHAGTFFTVFDWIVVGIFTIEIVLKFCAYNYKFFFDAWNVFDLIIVVICYIPNVGSVSALRALRAIRAFRTFKIAGKVRRLKIIVDSIFSSLPSVGWTSFLLLLFFYIYSIIGVNMYGNAFPDEFGTIPKTLFTLFQIMILDGWAMEIARPVMDVYPEAFVYFIPFILISSFIVMNVIVSIVVNTISDVDKSVETESVEVSCEVEMQDEDDEKINLDNAMLRLTDHLAVLQDLILKGNIIKERERQERENTYNDINGGGNIVTVDYGQTLDQSDDSSSDPPVNP